MKRGPKTPASQPSPGTIRQRRTVKRRLDAGQCKEGCGNPVRVGKQTCAYCAAISGAKDRLNNVRYTETALMAARDEALRLRATGDIMMKSIDDLLAKKRAEVPAPPPSYAAGYRDLD
jgi:hypothetical protein